MHHHQHQRCRRARRPRTPMPACSRVCPCPYLPARVYLLRARAVVPARMHAHRPCTCARPCPAKLHALRAYRKLHALRTYVRRKLNEGRRRRTRSATTGSQEAAGDLSGLGGCCVAGVRAEPGALPTHHRSPRAHPPPPGRRALPGIRGEVSIAWKLATTTPPHRHQA